MISCILVSSVTINEFFKSIILDVVRVALFHLLNTIFFLESSQSVSLNVLLHVYKLKWPEQVATFDFKAGRIPPFY